MILMTQEGSFHIQGLAGDMQEGMAGTQPGKQNTALILPLLKEFPVVRGIPTVCMSALGNVLS